MSGVLLAATTTIGVELAAIAFVWSMDGGGGCGGWRRHFPRGSMSEQEPPSICENQTDDG